jgi:hypothetical protein
VMAGRSGTRMYKKNKINMIRPGIDGLRCEDK